MIIKLLQQIKLYKINTNNIFYIKSQFCTPYSMGAGTSIKKEKVVLLKKTVSINFQEPEIQDINGALSKMMDVLNIKEDINLLDTKLDLKKTTLDFLDNEKIEQAENSGKHKEYFAWESNGLCLYCQNFISFYRVQDKKIEIIVTKENENQWDKIGPDDIKTVSDDIYDLVGSLVINDGKNNIYFSGGKEKPNDFFFLETTNTNNSTTHKLKMLPRLPQPRTSHTGCFLNNTLYLFGGQELQIFPDFTVDAYDISKGNWCSLPVDKYTNIFQENIDWNLTRVLPFKCGYFGLFTPGSNQKLKIYFFKLYNGVSLKYEQLLEIPYDLTVIDIFMTTKTLNNNSFIPGFLMMYKLNFSKFALVLMKIKFYFTESGNKNISLSVSFDWMNFAHGYANYHQVINNTYINCNARYTFIRPDANLFIELFPDCAYNENTFKKSFPLNFLRIKDGSVVSDILQKDSTYFPTTLIFEALSLKMPLYCSINPKTFKYEKIEWIPLEIFQPKNYSLYFQEDEMKFAYCSNNNLYIADVFSHKISHIKIDKTLAANTTIGNNSTFGVLYLISRNYENVLLVDLCKLNSPQYHELTLPRYTNIQYLPSKQQIIGFSLLKKDFSITWHDLNGVPLASVQNILSNKLLVTAVSAIANFIFMGEQQIFVVYELDKEKVPTSMMMIIQYSFVTDPPVITKLWEQKIVKSTFTFFGMPDLYDPYTKTLIFSYKFSRVEGDLGCIISNKQSFEFNVIKGNIRDLTEPLYHATKFLEEYSWIV